MRRVVPLLVSSAALAVTLSASAVGTRHFLLERGQDFEAGDLEGVAVDSAGAVRVGLTLSAVPVSQGGTIWSALARRDGSLLLGTGNEGKLIKVQGGTVSVAAETKALAVTSLVEAWGGSVALGTLPEGKIMKLERDKLSDLVKLPGADHVWQVAFDAKAGALYAATGPEGKLFRITREGNAQVYFDADEQHLMSVALAPDGSVYAGSSDKAKLYRIQAAGRASVVHDFERTEVRAIAVDAKGNVFAIANELKPRTKPTKKGTDAASSTASAPASPSKGKGVLYRFTREGVPDKLLEHAEDYYTSLALGDDEQPYVGTGVEGRVYSVDAGQNSVLVAEVDERQVTALLLRGGQKFLAASDPAVLHPVKGVGGPDAVWTSKVLDAGIRARFGQIEWQARGQIEISTRSGGTGEPDDSWSAWSREITAPGKVESPPARFLQVRARFARDPKAVLTDLDVAFVTDNLRAVLKEVKAGKEVDRTSSDNAVEASGGPIASKPDANMKIAWKVDNPDKDELRFRLSYQLVGANTWYDLTRPDEKLTKESHTWDTSDLPEGRYRIRVLASDELANPADRATRDQLESGIVLVDNTPPSIDGLTLDGKRLRAVVLDGVGPIQRVEVGVAGSSEWRPVFPKDGIFDEQREEIDADLSAHLPEGPALLSVRAYDGANNFVVRSAPLK